MMFDKGQNHSIVSPLFRIWGRLIEYRDGDLSIISTHLQVGVIN